SFVGQRWRTILVLVDLLDLVLLVLAVLAALSGYRRGALLQIVTYVGMIGGVIAGAALAPTVAALAEDPSVQAGLAIGTILVATVLGHAVGWFIGNRIRTRFRAAPIAGRVDAIGGSVVTVVAFLLVIWFLA